MAKRNPVSVAEYYRLRQIALSGPFERFLSEQRDYTKRHFVSIYRKSAVKRNSSRRDMSNAEDVEQIAYRFRGRTQCTEDETLLLKTVGSCRFLCNRMKADRDKYFEDTGKVLNRTPASYKEEFPFLKEVDSLALCNVQLKLESAYSDWLSGEHRKPKFKKKHQCKDSYTTNISSSGARNLRLEGNLLTLPKLSKPVELIVHRKIREDGILKNCTVTHEPSGEWSFSLVFEYVRKDYTEHDWIRRFLEDGDISSLRHVGLDMSLPYLYIDSNGDKASYRIGERVILFEKAYRKLEKRIAREQRKLSHMVKDSSNYRKQLERIASLHAKAKHQRKDFLHQLSCRLVRSYDIISIEDIDMSTVKKSLNFGKSVSDNGWGMFMDMLYYKAEREGVYVVKIDKWFPSSKKCFECGHIHKELQLSDRTYICPVCGNVMDRDYQAATNIDEEGVSEFLNTLTHNLPERYLKKKVA